MMDEPIPLLMAFEFKRWLHDRTVIFAAALSLSLIILGAWQYHQALPPRPQDDRLFGYAYLLFAVLALHTGIARDRPDRFDAFLAGNLMPLRDVFVARILVLLLIIVAIGVSAMAIGLITSRGDVAFAIWYPLLFTSVFLVFLPVIVLAEVVFNTRYPVAIVMLLFMTSMTALRHLGKAQPFLKVLGLDVERFDYADLTGLLARSVVALVATFACLPLYSWRVGAPLRRGLPV